MIQDLFLTELPEDVSTSGIELSGDIDMWPEEIQSIITQQVPVLMDFPGTLSFDSVDQDRRYAKGTYYIEGPDNNEGPEGNVVSFPILIKNGELYPIDVFIHEGKFIPVTSEAVLAALMPHDIGDELIKPEDISQLSTGYFRNSMSAPGSNYSGLVTSYGQSNQAKMGSVRKPFNKRLFNTEGNEKLAAFLVDNQLLRDKAITNPVFKQELINILNTGTEKTAATSMPEGPYAISITEPGVFSVKAVKVANGKLETVRESYTLSELDTFLKSAGINSVPVLAVLKRADYVETPAKNTPMVTLTPETVKTAGVYTCFDHSINPVDMEVLGSMKTPIGSASLAIDGNNNYSIQKELLGVNYRPLEKSNIKIASVVDDMKVGDNIVFRLSETELTPVTKIASITHFNQDTDKGKTINGETAYGKVAYIVLDNFVNSKPVEVERADMVPSYCFANKLASVIYFPKDSQMVKLSKEISLIENEEELATRSTEKFAGLAPFYMGDIKGLDKSNVEVIFYDHGRQVVDRPTASLLLKKAGVVDSMSKIAKLETGKTIGFVLSKEGEDLNKLVRSTLKSSTPIKLSASMADTIKVAAAMEEDETIDSVLALNYLTPSNLEEFRGELYNLKNTVSVLSKLLISIRLGNDVAEESAVRRTLQSLNELITKIEEYT